MELAGGLQLVYVEKIKMTGTMGSIPVAFVPQLMPKKHSEIEDAALTQK